MLIDVHRARKQRAATHDARRGEEQRRGAPPAQLLPESRLWLPLPRAALPAPPSLRRRCRRLACKHLLLERKGSDGVLNKVVRLRDHEGYGMCRHIKGKFKPCAFGYFQVGIVHLGQVLNHNPRT